MSGRVALTLYRHGESARALLLSATGRARDAHWVPRALVEEPLVTRLVRRSGESSAQGVFLLERWKAGELGWIDGDGEEEDQEALL